MSYRYVIDPDRRLALVTVSGSVDGTVFAEATRALYMDPAWGPGFDAIWDLTAVRQIVVEWEELQGLAAMDRQHAELAGDGRDIAVVARDLDEVVVEAYAHLSQGGPRRSLVCHSMQEAWDLLAGGADQVAPERSTPRR